MDFASIQVLILDVDGVLTDGRLSAGPDGDLKEFHVHDGCAIKRWQERGGKIAILSGRESRSVAARAAELRISAVKTGLSEKLVGYEEVLRSLGASDGGVAYVGDDHPDLPPMRRCGLPVAVANAVPEVKRAAVYVSRRCGGGGAVAEVIGWILSKQGA